MGESIAFYLIENGVEFEWEGHGNSSLAARVFLFLMIISKIFFRIHGMVMVVVNDKMTIVHLGGLSRLLRLSTALGARFVAIEVKGLGTAYGLLHETTLGFRRSRQLKGAHQALSQVGRSSACFSGRLRSCLLLRQRNGLRTTVGSVGDTHGVFSCVRKYCGPYSQRAFTTIERGKKSGLPFLTRIDVKEF